MFWHEKVDLEAYIRSRVAVLNTDGGRGYDIGVRIFDCPMPGCGDIKGRGWFNVNWGAAGCFNVGCMAEPKLPGLEWIGEVEGLPSKGQVVAYLLESFPARGPKLPPAPPRETYQDFCHFPPEMRLFQLDTSQLQLMFANFAQQQWGLNMAQLVEAGAGWCISGYYAWRIFFPIIMSGSPVAFQARSIKGAEPKYLTSRFVATEKHPAECGRPAEALLYGLDEIRIGEELAMVEGIGDTLALRYQHSRQAVGLLGTQLTSEKLALLREKRPGRVIVALDTSPETEEAALEIVRNLLAWDLDAVRGIWAGAKDAGAGGRLELQTLGIIEEIARRLR